MKKVFLAVALMAVVAVSCKKVETPASVTTPDSTTVVVDSVSVDTTAVAVDSVAVTK
jgi:PBP1b-binding outer membrane lipoprotein LpoB